MATAVNTAFFGTGISDRLRGLIANVKEAQAKRALYRTTYFELSSLSDRDLADLGFSRYDIASIAREHVYGK
ncbi:DUF1127 domain-containing protein [Cognatishimia sp. SS12]|uniref:DUF1127 domain-containing protein n=1 Tax=Cognatishimia sp. SS12 TaxID=2979465 RepID=UPI00232FBB77|nr:DUF1127 domain-containing protein [Cognatishimia sp. SS12]MDC0738364.1 DUF1127 domain-containing protein [Cognatishimia sp. SS12]